MKKIKILTYLPHYIKHYGIGYAAHSIAVGMNTESVMSDIFSIRSDLVHESKYVKEAFGSKFEYVIATKLLDNAKLIRLTEQRFKKRMKQYDVAYLWPGCSLETVKILKQSGKSIVIENINCHQRYARNILDAEAIALGMPKFHSITDESIDEEDEKLRLADFVFSPSPQVTKSLLAADVAKHKIIESSYGLDAKEIIDGKNISKDLYKVNALFVGSVIPRKGIHLLLDYWKSSNVDAKLTVVGKVDVTAASLVDSFSDCSNIEFVPFTDDLESYYSKADIFLMPSLEEGSPLVTYLALGAGLPAVLSPMAGDGVYQNEKHGFILEPHDKTAWIDAIVRLVNNQDLRSEMSTTIQQNTQHFLWPAVAHRRVVALLNKLENI